METATQETYQGRNSNLIEKLVRSKWFWIVACGFFFIYPLSKSVQRKLPKPLPVFSAVPHYQLQNEFGKPFGSENLKGRVYIASFLFTSCQTFCPDLLGKLQKIQHRLRGVMDRAAIISFTVDPETDTSEVLLKKSQEVKSNPSVWNFLTGPKDQIQTLLVDGFKVPMGEKEYANNVMDVAHSNRLVLVDQEGNIRGYYSTDKEGINKLMIDTGLLINFQNSLKERR